MRRWDRLVDSYMEEYRARGVGAATVGTRHRGWSVGAVAEAAAAASGDRGDRRGADHAVHREPHELSGQVDRVRHAQLRCAASATFWCKEGLWTTNPLRWMKGPKVTPYSRLPKRIDREHMEALWREAAHRRGRVQLASLDHRSRDAVRNGPAPRRARASGHRAFDRTEGTLRIDGRKTGRERCVPLPEMVLRCLEAYLPLRHNHWSGPAR